MVSDSLFLNCKSCGEKISKSVKVCPECGKKQKKLTAFKWIGISFCVLFVIGVFISPDSPSNDTTVAKQAIEKSTPTIDMIKPADQAQFIEIIERFEKRYSSAKNELQQSLLRDERKAMLSISQIGSSVSGWVGTIDTLQTNTEGKAILSVKISENIELKTWNNALSDINSNTLIDKGSDLYGHLLNLSIGERVKFSGKLFPSKQDYFEETSMTINGSMKYAEFLFKFTSVDSLNNSKDERSE